MPASPLVAPLTELRRHLGARREVEASVDLPGLATSTAAVVDGEPVEVDLVIESIPQGVSVSGTVRARWVGQCRRCLDDVLGDVDVDVKEIFERMPTEGETWPLGADEIDLEPVVREAVLLALPLAPLCDEGCLGPAPDRFPATVEDDDDRDDEGEAELPRDPRWAALDQLDLGD
ncbi:MAG: DUF177 domain-containing protein [Acidimicrobiia bacterium]|nr:DUF177 domain-containing protein [Acidimicrobiia bacterium]